MVSSKRQPGFLLYNRHNLLHLFKGPVILLGGDIEMYRGVVKGHFHNLVSVFLTKDPGTGASRQGINAIESLAVNTWFPLLPSKRGMTIGPELLA